MQPGFREDRHKVFVLLSGGADSTTTLAIARRDFPKSRIQAMTVDYGQRHRKEMEYAKTQAVLYQASLEVMNMQLLMTGAIVGDEGSIPDASYSDLPTGISPTYVSFRNGLMLSALAAKAQSWIMDQEATYPKKPTGGYNTETGEPYFESPSFYATIYCGVHADDGAHWAYPDCTPEFVGAIANAIYIGTYGKVRVRAPLQYYSKADVIRHGHRLGVDYARTWSCYRGEESHCGTCPTCRSRKEAFELAGVLDPTFYDK